MFGVKIVQNFLGFYQELSSIMFLSCLIGKIPTISINLDTVLIHQKWIQMDKKLVIHFSANLSI